MDPSMADVISAYRAQMVAGRIVEAGLRLASTVEAPASVEEVALAWPDGVADDAMDLWKECRSARLFADIDYGQWGLRLFAPEESRQHIREEVRDRSEDFHANDVVIGEFLGDSDLLVLAPAASGDHKVMVATGMEHRDEWEGVGNDLARFLATFFVHDGEKYWEIDEGNPTGHLQATCHKCALLKDHGWA